MNPKYTQRATIATPASHIPDANQLSLCLGEASADDKTFSTASYQDAQGNLYAVCSTVAKPFLAQLAGQPLQDSDHAPYMDVEAATRAQALLQINGGTASPDVIAVILGDRKESAQDHIKVLGLTRVENSDEM